MTKKHIQTIVICCPGNVISGGVNSLHNLCKSLQECGFNSMMHYISPDETVLCNHQITSYGVKQLTELKDDPTYLVVVPETMVSYLLQFSKAQKMVYWLGLNYFFKNPLWRFPFNLKGFRKLISCRSYAGYSSGWVEDTKRKLNEYAKSHLDIWNGNVIHLSNSHFVADYCRRKGAPSVFVLHNPIRQEFYNFEPDYTSRENLILFGPKTPKQIIRKLGKYLPDYSIIRLRKLPLEKVFELMSKAKIFAEFGNYSGRDRMPREAAMLGCTIFMNTRGTAAFNEDYQVPDNYRITDHSGNRALIIEQLVDTALHYNKRITDFEPFRAQLKNERSDFLKNTQQVFESICGEGFIKSTLHNDD
ncbi:MAG: hypothetical protein JEZ14_19295 [Marinilabiliaceae bacterium]|nr:hypothetical protein [Marinilabiliaceae bacterium]